MKAEYFVLSSVSAIYETTKTLDRGRLRIKSDTRWLGVVGQKPEGSSLTPGG